MTITGDRFQNFIKKVFTPFLKEMGFTPESPHLSGRYYRVNFIGDVHTLVVSFEPADSFFTVMLVRNDDNDLSAIDDPERTPRLADLNRMYMSQVTPSEREKNESFFSKIRVKDRSEQVLLKSAKDLRLVLPRYLKTQP